MTQFVQYEFAGGLMLGALAAGPALFAAGIAGLTEDESDIRPDPGRFTIRETMAHVAAFESVALERLRRVAGEDEPTLAAWNQSGLFAAFARSNPKWELAVFAERRERTTEFLEQLPAEAWDRAARRPEGPGLFTLEALVATLTWHDTDHLAQIAARRRAYGQPNCQS